MATIWTSQTVVNNLQGNVTSLEGNVTSLEDQVTDLEDQVEVLQGNVTMLQGNVTMLQDQVDVLRSVPTPVPSTECSPCGICSVPLENTNIGSCKNSDCSEGVQGVADGINNNCYCDNVCSLKGDCCEDVCEFCPSEQQIDDGDGRR